MFSDFSFGRLGKGTCSGFGCRFTLRVPCLAILASARPLGLRVSSSVFQTGDSGFLRHLASEIVAAASIDIEEKHGKLKNNMRAIGYGRWKAAVQWMNTRIKHC